MAYGYSPTNVQTVYTSGSGRIRGLFTTLDGTPVRPEEVRDITLTILHKFLGQYTPVSHYNGVSIPVAQALSATVQTDPEGQRYNLDFDPYDGEHFPFPTRDTYYTLELVFTSRNGARSVHQLEVRSK